MSGVPLDPSTVRVLVAGWVIGSAVGGLAAALVARRVHESIPFFRTWLVYAGLVGLLVGAALLVGLT